MSVAQIKGRGLTKKNGDDSRILPITLDGKTGWSNGQLADLGNPPWDFTETMVRDMTPYVRKRQKEQEVFPIIIWKPKSRWQEGDTMILASADETVAQAVEPRFYVHFLRKYKNARFFTINIDGAPIRVEVDGETVGGFMPIGFGPGKGGSNVRGKPHISGKELVDFARQEAEEVQNGL